MHPDLFITIAFVSLVVALAILALVFALHERRRDAVDSREISEPTRSRESDGAAR